jgi:hypothetical protein
LTNPGTLIQETSDHYFHDVHPFFDKEQQEQEKAGPSRIKSSGKAMPFCGFATGAETRKKRIASSGLNCGRPSTEVSY